MRCVVLCALVLAQPGRTCSLQNEKGVSIAAIDQTSSFGSIGANRVRLRLIDWQDSKPRRSAQAILDFATGTLEPHDNTMEWQPTVIAYEETANGAVVPGVGVNASWTGSDGVARRAVLPLPNVTEAWWWYSAAFDRVIVVHRDSAEFHLAACTAAGACTHARDWSGHGGNVFDPTRAATAWDAEALVGLPLMCCVCITASYYTFGLAADGSPQLTAVSALDTLGPSWYDPAADEVWTAPLQYTGYQPTLEVTRTNYATGTSETRALPAARVEALFPSAGLAGWAIALIVLGVLLVVGALAALGWRTRRRGQAQKEGKQMTSASEGVVVVPSAKSTPV